MITEEQIPATVGVLMVGFNPIVNEGLQTILTKDERIKVIGEVPNEQAAVETIKQAQTRGQQVRVVLTETRTTAIDGVRVTKLINQEFPEVAVLVLTEDLNDSYIIDAIQSGAAGYIFLKDITPELLVRSIYRAVEGGSQISTTVLRSAVEHFIQNGGKTLSERTIEKAHLTEREVDVLKLMGDGDSNKIIAATLGITLDTTKKHVHNVIDKLQARSRTHAAIIAAQVGITSNPINDAKSVLETKSISTD